MIFGTRFNLFSRHRSPNPRAAVPGFLIETAWLGSSLFSEPAADGTTSPPNWGAVTGPHAFADSSTGLEPESGRRSGSAYSTTWAKVAKWTPPVQSSTAPPFGRFGGDPHRPQPYGSRQIWLQTPYNHRFTGSPAHARSNSSQHTGRQTGHPAIGFDPAHSGAARPSAIPTPNISRRSRVRMGLQHPLNSCSRHTVSSGSTSRQGTR
jgi:hypothetical protein